MIELVDQTFRDGQQSLWGMRLRGGMLRKVAGELDRSGFRAVEVTGSSLMECSVRYSREDPWESPDLWRTWLPSSELRSPVCQNRIGTFGMTPDALMDLWVRTLVRHGVDALWVYDCLYNMAQMKRLCDVLAETGAKALGAIMYGISPVHGPSLPSTEQTVANLDRLGFEHGIDEAALPPVADHCARIARQEGWLVGEPLSSTRSPTSTTSPAA